MNDESIELRSVLADPALAGVYVVEASGLSDFLAAAWPASRDGTITPPARTPTPGLMIA